VRASKKRQTQAQIVIEWWTNMAFSQSTSRILLVYTLPFLHGCGCIATAIADLDSGWKYIGLVDFPVSIAAVGLSMHYDVPPLIFFGLIGTLWWYLLSRTALFVFDRFRNLRKPGGSVSGVSP
jgi:hypothetical protein